MTSHRLDIIQRHLKKPAPPHPVLQLKPTSAELTQNFTYTVPTDRLTPQQRAFYDKNGFLVVRKLVPKSLLEQFRQRFLSIVEGDVPRGGITMMKDVTLKNHSDISNERLVNKLQDFVYDEVLSQHFTLPEILDYIECFIGPNIVAVHTMLINKPPDPGSRTSRHPLHQDLHYFPFRPANKIVCAWTAMEKVTTDNGCLFVLPGTHKGQLEQHDYPDWEDGVNKLYHGVRGYDHLKKVYLTMEPGDTVFFHPLLLHGSGANVTQGFRKAISCHYASSDCHYIDIRNTSQENIAKEVEEIVRRRGVSEFDYQTLWKFRSRLVRGREGPLTAGTFGD